MEFQENQEDFDTGFFSEQLFHSINPAILKESLLCPLMPHFLRKPLQCPHCHVHFCEKCLRKALENSDKCPLCRLQISDLSSCSCKAAKIVVNLLDSLRVSCENAAKGCERTFLQSESQDFTRHLAEDCGFVEEACGNYLCSFRAIRKEIATHRKNCSEDQLSCMYCEKTVKRAELTRHVMDCLDICRWCDKEYVKCKEPEHVENCEMSWVVCLYCQRTVVKRDWEKHRENACLLRKVVVLNNRQVIRRDVRVLRNNEYFMYRF